MRSKFHLNHTSHYHIFSPNFNICFLHSDEEKVPFTQHAEVVNETKPGLWLQKGNIFFSVFISLSIVLITEIGECIRVVFTSINGDPNEIVSVKKTRGDC